MILGLPYLFILHLTLFENILQSQGEIRLLSNSWAAQETSRRKDFCNDLLRLCGKSLEKTRLVLAWGAQADG